MVISRHAGRYLGPYAEQNGRPPENSWKKAGMHLHEESDTNITQQVMVINAVQAQFSVIGIPRKVCGL